MSILLLLALAQSPCANLAEYRSLDFTIGRWTVVDAEGHPTGASNVQYDLDGCTIVENWEAPGGVVKGRNVDAYNAEDGHWHRFFVDSRGHVHVFEGVRDGASIRYEGRSTGPNGAPVLNRLTIRQDGPDHLKELWEKSTDSGQTWTTAFQGVYTRVSRGT